MCEKNFATPSIKPLQTKRPFTPRDKERLLFGNKAKVNRPPSSFSLRYLENESELPTTPPESSILLSSNLVTSKSLLQSPSSKTTIKHQRSNSLSEFNDKIFNISIKEPAHKVKLPSLDQCRPLQKRKIFKNISLDNLPEETETTVEQQKIESRNAFSSPEERTNVVDTGTMFGRSSVKQEYLSQCLLLGPENLEKLFDNKQIVENSQTLFLNTGYFTSQLNKSNLKNNSPVAIDLRKKRNLENVVEDLNSATGDHRVITLLEELYSFMEQENMLNSKVPSKLKVSILKCLYKFVESKNEDILINIAKIILTLKVTGNNLSGVCKLIFKVAKNDQNDHLFFQKNLLELFLDALGRSSPIDDSEACVYGYGAVKFLTMNQQLVEKFLALGILQLMVLHMKLINATKMEKTHKPEQTNHVLFQLTAALRNLVSDENVNEILISCGAINPLCQTLEIFSLDQDIVANISRTLSMISTNDSCCDIIESNNVYKTFISLFGKYTDNEEIIVRLTFTLGNIVAKIDNTRFYNEENSIESLLDLWKKYLERTLQAKSLILENHNGESNPEDVMIKIIRVIANMVINPEVGKALNEKYGNALIDEILKVLISNPFKKNEQLVLSILSTLNNLSYYYTSETQSDIFHIKQIDIVQGINEFAESKNRECVIETLRIMGNLSRSKISRAYFAESEIFYTLLNLLQMADPGLLKTTVGVFVNLLSDNKSRNLFKKKDGVSKLITVLKNYCEGDWLLGNLVCQALWNYCTDAIDLNELLSESEIQQLLEILADYLDEEKLFGIEENTQDTDVYVTQEYLIWEEFANVATNLLEKIEYFLDTFDQINLDAEKEDELGNVKDSSTNLSFAAW